jgi:sensor domain CHASE-containing protein
MRGMNSLRSKVLGILALLLTVVGLLSFGISSKLLDLSLADFEKRAASDQFQRVELALKQDIEAFVRNTVNHAVWDDAALHVRKYDETYMDKYFTTVSMENVQAHAAAFFTLDHTLHSSVDLQSGQRRALQESSPLGQAMRSALPDPARQAGAHVKRWIAGKPVLLAISPVRSDQPWAANVGWLVMARGLEEGNLRELEQSTGGRFHILKAPQVSDTNTAPAPATGTSSASPAATGNRSSASAPSKLLSDSLGDSELVLEVELPKDLDTQRTTGQWPMRWCWCCWRCWLWSGC